LTIFSKTFKIKKAVEIVCDYIMSMSWCVWHVVSRLARPLWLLRRSGIVLGGSICRVDDPSGGLCRVWYVPALIYIYDSAPIALCQ